MTPSSCQKQKQEQVKRQKISRSEADKLEAAPGLELDQVNDQVVNRRRDGAGGEEACLLLGHGQVEKQLVGLEK